MGKATKPKSINVLSIKNWKILGEKSRSTAGQPQFFPIYQRNHVVG